MSLYMAIIASLYMHSWYYTHKVVAYRKAALSLMKSSMAPRFPNTWLITMKKITPSLWVWVCVCVCLSRVWSVCVCVCEGWGIYIPVHHSTGGSGKLEVDPSHNQSKYHHHKSLHKNKQSIVTGHWHARTAWELCYWNGNIGTGPA